MKVIVTHISPDLDAISSCWMIIRYFPGWSKPLFKFVNAGQTLNNRNPDENPDILHVDTGLGKFDHHQFQDKTCAAKRVFEYLIENGHIQKKDIPALERMIVFVTDIDHFLEVNFPEPTSDRYDFCLHQIVKGLEIVQNDENKIEVVLIMLDSILYILKNKLKAISEIEDGFVCYSRWGKTLILETKNEESVKLALKMGYGMVVRKDPEKGNIRIKTFPDPKYDLTLLYEKIIEVDKKGTWFFHVSKHMLLNGSSKNLGQIPSLLTLQRLIEIIKGI
jgi:hypothetical protein